MYPVVNSSHGDPIELAVINKFNYNPLPFLTVMEWWWKDQGYVKCNCLKADEVKKPLKVRLVEARQYEFDHFVMLVKGGWY